MDSNRLCIGLVSSAYWPIVGGMEVYLHKLAHALARENEVTVATRFVDHRPEHIKAVLTTAQQGRRYTEGGVSVRILSPNWVGQQLLRPVYKLHFYPTTFPTAVSLFCAAHLPQLLEELKGSDIIHYSGTGREMLGFCAYRAARTLGVPFVVTSHMHIGSWGDGEEDFSLYRRADTMVALTEVERSHLIEQGIPGEKTAVIGHGVNVEGTGDGDRFRRAHGIDGPIILFLGRKAAYKGYPLLLEAAPLVWRKIPETTFIFAGPSDPGLQLSPDLLAIAADPRVIDVGRISDSEREDAYAACDIFCLPSEAEAFGLVYLESWAYAKPVVSLCIPTLQELIGGVGGGVLAEKSPGSVADALVNLLSDSGLRGRMGKAGHARARQRSWSKIADVSTTLYRRLVESKHARLAA